MFRLIFSFLIVGSLVACSNSSKRRNTPNISSNPTMPFQFKPSLPIGSEGKPQNAPVLAAKQFPVPTETPSTITNTASPTTTVSASTTSVGSNPNHGQPGHRCDIAVGAPLNSVPVTASNTNPVTSQPVVTQQPTPAATKATTKAGVNPNHGQPGHRCDIAVGAPLNSAPIVASSGSNTTSTPAANQNTISTATPVTPAVSQVGSTDKNVKLNPAHGQPGHDCTIAVGQPLKK